jgi:hypothetical protein
LQRSGLEDGGGVEGDFRSRTSERSYGLISVKNREILVFLILQFLPRLTGAALVVVMKEWHTTPDRCDPPMKGRLSSTPVPAASGCPFPLPLPFLFANLKIK